MPVMPELKSYKDAESWLLSVTDYERLLGRENIIYNTRTFDLEHFREQLKRFGDPQKRFAVFHVAGTKGKGSTCAFLEAALRSCGYRTGLYTSPHLYRFTERIRIDGSEIDDLKFCGLLEQTGKRLISAATDQDSDQRSFRTVFEILTAAAFQHFADKQVDVAIIETGLGGRLDSTNVFDEKGAGPLVNVITAIGLDHTSILGNTVEAIAGEKAGIIRGHARIVLGQQANPEYQRAVEQVVRSRHHAVSAKFPVQSSGNAITISRPNSSAGKFHLQLKEQGCGGPLGKALEGGIEISPSLEGLHQAHNAATALLALVEFENALQLKEWPQRPSGGEWPSLMPAEVVSGLEQTLWPGRFTVVEARVPVVVDGAHCTISAAALAAACRSHFGKKSAVVVTGFMKDKAGDEMLRTIGEQVPVIGAVALPPPSPRAQASDHIVQALAEVFGGSSVESADSMQAALDKAVEMAAAVGGYVIVFGSLYLVGPAFDALKQDRLSGGR